MHLLLLPRECFVATLRQFSSPDIFLCADCVCILRQLDVSRCNSMQSLQSILAAGLVGVGGAFVVVTGRDGIGPAENSSGHSLLSFEAIVFSFCHFIDFGLAREGGDNVIGSGGGFASENFGWARHVRVFCHWDGSGSRCDGARGGGLPRSSWLWCWFANRALAAATSSVSE